MARAGVSRPAPAADEGVDGLRRDKTRKPGTAPIAIVAITSLEPPGAVTLWCGRAMAKVFGVSLQSIRRIQEEHRPQPHRLAALEQSYHPAFADKVGCAPGLKEGK